MEPIVISSSFLQANRNFTSVSTNYIHPEIPHDVTPLFSIWMVWPSKCYSNRQTKWRISGHAIGTPARVPTCGPGLLLTAETSRSYMCNHIPTRRLARTAQLDFIVAPKSNLRYERPRNQQDHRPAVSLIHRHGEVGLEDRTRDRLAH